MDTPTPQVEASFYGETDVNASGAERWIEDTRKELDLDAYYMPHQKQHQFHSSPKPHRLLGGAAGPGKSLALIMDHLATCITFSDPTEAKQVHTLLLRRTVPQLKGSLIPRFREKVPRELYAKYNETDHIVTWPNGASTHFGSMQYEQDVWNFQGGQYLQIDFDELTQFVLYQWFTISAWNRCPVSPYARKGGATNPVGVSASDFACLFGADGKGKRPSPNMDDNQRRNYHPEDYEYFPCTFLDNPIYANDPVFIKNLENYPTAIRDALKYGIWGALGTYFDIWDEAIHTYEPGSIEIKPYWPVWMSGDWGFAHWAANYWHTLTDFGQVLTFHEFVTDHEEPEQLAESLVKEHLMLESTLGRKIQLEPWMFYSHDAFHQKYSANTIANQMSEKLKKGIGIQLVNAGTDKKGGEQLMYSLLKQRVRRGEYVNEATGERIPNMIPKWMISKACNYLLAKMPMAPRAGGIDDPGGDDEEIKKFDGDDPIDGARHGIYGKFSGKVKIPIESQIAERVTSSDPTIRHIQTMKAERDVRKENITHVGPKRWRPPIH